MLYGVVDVDHLYPSEIALVEELQHLKVVALDEDVAGGIEVQRLGALRDQGGPAGLCQDTDGIALAGPGEGVPLRPVIDGVSQREAQLVEVEAPFAGGLGKQLKQRRRPVSRRRRDLTRNRVQWDLGHRILQAGAAHRRQVPAPPP